MIIRAFRSLRWTDYSIYAIIDPRALVRILKSDPSKLFWFSYLIPFIVSFFHIITLSLLSSYATHFFYIKLTYGLIFVFFILSFHVLIYSLLIDFIAQFLNFKGYGQLIVIILNFSLIPLIFVLPLTYFCYILNFAPLFFYVFFILLTLLWQWIILIQCISELYACDLGKAIIISIFPPLFFFLSVILVGVLFFSILYSYLS